MLNGDFLIGIQGLTEWLGYLILPTLSVLCVISGILSFGQRQDSQRAFIAALACLMGPALALLVHSFVTAAPPAGVDAAAGGLMHAVNWIGNVLLPTIAAIYVVRGVLVVGHFMERINIGDDWVRYFIVAFGCLTVSGITRLLEHFVTTAKILSTTSMLTTVSGGGTLCHFV